MKKIETKIPGVVIIEPDIHGDHRGYFMETYSTSNFHELGIDNVFVQDNMSFTAKKGTLRGLHFQNDPMAQAKLVSCTKGTVIDVAVDIRKGSPTYKQWVAVELSEENKKMFFIPRGFAHGFLVTSDEAEFIYKTTNYYAPGHQQAIIYNDPILNIDWPFCSSALSLSQKDQEAKLFSELLDSELF